MTESVQPENKKRDFGTLIIIVLLLIVLILLFLLSPLKELVFPSTVEPELTLVVVESSGPDTATGLSRVVVEAIVEGKPEPQVTFNRNDGIGELETNQTLIMLAEEESFLLKAVASNPHGTAEAELELYSGIIVAARAGSDGISTPADPDSDDALAPGNGETDRDHDADPSDPSAPPAPDSGGPDIADPAPAPRPGEPAPEADPAELPRPAEPLPPAPPAPDDPEDDEVPDPLVPPPPGGNGSFSIAPFDPGPGVVFAPIPSRLTLRAIRPESGHIIKDHSVFTNYYVYAGDDPYNRINRGFVSFDISDLAGATVTKVTLRMANPIIRGNPSIFFSGSQGLDIFAIDWHSDNLQIADYYRTGTRIGTFQSYDITRQSVVGGSYPVLAEQLQLRINSRSDRFRLRLQWAKEVTNNNNQEDGVRYFSPQNDITLTVEYTR